MTLSDQLCSRIWDNEQFHGEMKTVYCQSIAYGFGYQGEVKDTDSIGRLLQCATALAASGSHVHRRAAYEICISCWNIVNSCEKLSNEYDVSSVASIVALILGRLGNFPALGHFNNHVLGGTHLHIPFTLAVENETHKLINSIKINPDSVITATDLQKMLWDALQNYKSISVSAPTSAGKSFILQHFIVSSFVSKACERALYIVPTRALISQVISDIQSIVGEYHDIDIDVSEVPFDPEESKATLYVLTQERVQLLLEATSKSFQLVIADEIQNINDPSRGVILQAAIENLIDRNPDARIVFGAPFAKGISKLHNFFNLNRKTSGSITSHDAAVIQNLILLNVDPILTTQVAVRAYHEGLISDEICKINIGTELISEDQTIANVAHYIGHEAINIVYGSEQAKCEKIATHISDISVITDDDFTSVDPEIVEFSKFIKREIHSDYRLAKEILHGVAFHYGGLPAFLRKGVESLFSRGKLRYLVCTSTLLQGVNLPAQNIFMLNPTKGKVAGKKIPITSAEFWNLAGRAGRLTKDFEGNVYMLNVNEWLFKLDVDDKATSTEPALVNYVTERRQDLLNYIDSDSQPSGDKATAGLENAFMKLFYDFSKGRLDRSLPQNTEDQVEFFNQVLSRFEKIRSRCTLPFDIIQKNQSVSVFVQVALYDYFLKSLNNPKKGPRYLIPQHPLRPWKSIVEQYVSLFRRINMKFKKLPYQNRQCEYLAKFALIWMRGTSYSSMLGFRIARRNTELVRKKADPNTVARELFKEIETDLRFTYVKFTKCYSDILAFALVQTGNTEYLGSLPPLHLFLELGACSQTMISIIGHGISRTSAFLLSKTAPRSDMDSAESYRWLKSTGLSKFDLPTAVISEVQSVLR
ncbi:MAG: DEAD/DEAH box helicase [Humidesulfovibrio sp.]|uniref:DEAD/DEAH box helicase n=1 Tax=Humidesulfovibrio sp. TaxID=2910988 RepID=UPI002735C5F7|nr:DEAD/DEAH box helicase [Humidesulfovibrio sp.]MDP2846940.1 DEAD/DEAH box helicase [Humidesulfovibrio sp.]